MKLGPSLVITSAILASLILSLCLFVITAGASLQQPIKNEGTDPSQATVPDPSTSTTSGEGNSGCGVSDKYPSNILQWCQLITAYSQKTELPADLIAAVIYQESGGNQQAYSSSGAVGLMQVMPRDGLAESFTCSSGPCFKNRPSTNELQDPEFNIQYGTRMLKSLTAKLGSYREALKSYGPIDVGYYYADRVLQIYERFRK